MIKRMGRPILFLNQKEGTEIQLRLLILLLIIIPAAEIGIFVLAGNKIGILPTVALIILSGIIGAYLAKQQGLETIRKVQRELGYGRIPGDALLDGVCILVGGAFLLTPGFITDTAGFLLLAPPTRVFFKKLLVQLFQKWINKGKITIIR
jgi:UPF0716 protein FxsA